MFKTFYAPTNSEKLSELSDTWNPRQQYCSAQILPVEHMGYEYTGGS